MVKEKTELQRERIHARSYGSTAPQARSRAGLPRRRGRGHRKLAGQTRTRSCPARAEPARPARVLRRTHRCLAPNAPAATGSAPRPRRDGTIIETPLITANGRRLVIAPTRARPSHHNPTTHTGGGEGVACLRFATAYGPGPGGGGLECTLAGTLTTTMRDRYLPGPAAQTLPSDPLP